jgi:predicted Rossmann fold nucleotide-binding protein DprA/Smf involved in DNA uptake
MMTHDLWLLYSQDESMTISSRKQKAQEWEIAFEEHDISWLKRWTQENAIHWTIQGELDFPAKAYHIISSPHILYYLGNLDLLQIPILGIVGPRRHSAYATQILQELLPKSLQRSGFLYEKKVPEVSE